MVAKFWLDLVVLERAGGFRPFELNTIAKLVEKHREELLERWYSSLDIEIHEARAQAVQVTDEALRVELVDGRTVIVPLVWFPRLWHGTPEERNHLNPTPLWR